VNADPTIPDGSGLTPLMYAAIDGWNRTITVLVTDMVDINEGSEQRWTALHWAVLHHHLETVKLLLEMIQLAMNGTDLPWT